MSLDRSTTILRPLASEPEKVNISAARTAWPASNRTFGQFVGDRKRVWVDGVGQHDPDVVLDGGLDVEGQVIDEPRQLLVACLGVRSWRRIRAVSIRRARAVLLWRRHHHRKRVAQGVRRPASELHAGNASPHGMQPLLGEAVWDAETRCATSCAIVRLVPLGSRRPSTPRAHRPRCGRTLNPRVRGSSPWRRTLAEQAVQPSSYAALIFGLVLQPGS
jgi:hypothetical protein